MSVKEVVAGVLALVVLLCFPLLLVLMAIGADKEVRDNNKVTVVDTGWYRSNIETVEHECHSYVVFQGHQCVHAIHSPDCKCGK